MSGHDGDLGARLKAVAAGWGRACADLILPPPMEAGRAGASLEADAWRQVAFLEAPVCDGCGAAFEFDGGMFAESRCAACLAKPYAFERARAACVYDDASRGLVLRFKHGDHQPLAPVFARWIHRSAAELIEAADAIAPIPLHPLRLLARRFNQAAEIARPLAVMAGRDYLADALVRARRTDSQGGKSGRGRRENVRGAFSVTSTGARRVRGRRILLIDDVLTTGATGEACAKALLEAGARAVDLAVVARVRTARQLPM
ncbi:competence protein ComF [Brevundimonas sp. Leaf363]|uniref:ComF family protein n=1 Tax=Brevundimonas sp. Leaf363 TaxID=1736353 RepID=UPI0006F9BF95|nr:ComF family protein [Brevundimonas sp. Leaf363]KQS55235.1 competence protein ComF [Brevundimonas sp. Leaf363]